MEEVHVDQVEGRAPQAPPRPQVPLAGPAPLGEVRERELALLRQPGGRFRAAAAVKVADARVRASEEVEVPLLKNEEAARGLTHSVAAPHPPDTEPGYLLWPCFPRADLFAEIRGGRPAAENKQAIIQYSFVVLSPRTHAQ